MKYLKLALLLKLSLSMLLIAGATPQNPPDEDGKFCHPSHLADIQCMCLAMGGYMDCSEGKKTGHEHEKVRCGTFCKLDHCLCCSVLKNQKPKGGEKK